MFKRSNPSGRPSCNRRLICASIWLILLIPFTGCKKRAGQSTIDEVPVTVSDPAPAETSPEPVPAESIPAATDPEPEPLPDPVDPLPPAWEAGDLLFSRLDFEDACQAYSESGPDLPPEVRTRAILACASGSDEQRRLSHQWLQLQLEAEDTPESIARWRAVEQLLSQMQGESEKVAQLQREMAKLAEELEMLKKIDSQRRRP